MVIFLWFIWCYFLVRKYNLYIIQWRLITSQRRTHLGNINKYIITHLHRLEEKILFLIFTYIDVQCDMPFFLIKSTNIDWTPIIRHKPHASYREGICSISELQLLAITALFVCNLCFLGYFCYIGLYSFYLPTCLAKMSKYYVFSSLWFSEFVCCLFNLHYPSCYLPFSASHSNCEAKYFKIFLSYSHVFIILQQLLLILKVFILCLVNYILYSLFFSLLLLGLYF